MGRERASIHRPPVTRPQPETRPVTQAVPLPGIKPPNLFVCGMTPKPPVRATVGLLRLELGMLLKCFPSHLPSLMPQSVAGPTRQEAEELPGQELCLSASSFSPQHSACPWHTSVERMNGSMDANQKQTKPPKNNFTIMGETWQHISEREKSALEKSADKR